MGYPDETCSRCTVVKTKMICKEPSILEPKPQAPTAPVVVEEEEEAPAATNGGAANISKLNLKVGQIISIEKVR